MRAGGRVTHGFACRLPGRLTDSETKQRAAHPLAQVPRNTLTEREAKQGLALYGAPVVEKRLATTRPEAVYAARQLECRW